MRHAKLETPCKNIAELSATEIHIQTVNTTEENFYDMAYISKLPANYVKALNFFFSSLKKKKAILCTLTKNIIYILTVSIIVF